MTQITTAMATATVRKAAPPAGAPPRGESPEGFLARLDAQLGEKPISARQTDDRPGDVQARTPQPADATGAREAPPDPAGGDAPAAGRPKLPGTHPRDVPATAGAADGVAPDGAGVGRGSTATAATSVGQASGSAAAGAAGAVQGTGSPTAAAGPSVAPSGAPSVAPNGAPSVAPSGAPSIAPTVASSVGPGGAPSVAPAGGPSVAPSTTPVASAGGAENSAPAVPPTATAPAGAPLPSGGAAPDDTGRDVPPVTEAGRVTRSDPSDGSLAASRPAPDAAVATDPAAAAPRPEPRSPETSTAVRRVIEAVEQLENQPPPRRLTIEVGDVRLRLAIEDGQLRLTLLGGNHDDGADLLRQARQELAGRGFDLGDESGRPPSHREPDGEQPPYPGGDPAPSAAGRRRRAGDEAPATRSHRGDRPEALRL